MIKFKVGDRIKCIGLPGFDSHFEIGKIYTVIERDRFMADCAIKVRENSRYYAIDSYFVLTEKRKNPTYKEVLKLLNDQI